MLKKIVAKKRERLKEAKRELTPKMMSSLLKHRSFTTGGRFRKAISGGNGFKLIAEIKQASPSKGLLVEDFDIERLAAVYAGSEAAAISVLTEEDYFLGSLENIALVKAVTDKPVLRKDFLLDIYQIMESALVGADAVLLIVSILKDKELFRLLEAAREYGLDALVEVHDEAELERALSAGAGLIGINNRNLSNFKVDLDTSRELIKIIPEGKVVVSESGIHTNRDVEELKTLGFAAALVGEAIVTSKDPAAKIKELLTVNC